MDNYENQNNNISYGSGYQYGYQQNPYTQIPRQEPPKQKKSGASALAKKFLAVFVAAIMFGVGSAGAFLGTSRLINYLDPEETATVTQTVTTGTTKIKTNTDGWLGDSGGSLDWYDAYSND